MLIILTALTAGFFCISKKRLFLPGSGRMPPGLWADGLNLVSDQGKCLVSRKWTRGKENAGNDVGRAQVKRKSC